MASPKVTEKGMVKPPMEALIHVPIGVARIMNDQARSMGFSLSEYLTELAVATLEADRGDFDETVTISESATPSPTYVRDAGLIQGFSRRGININGARKLGKR